MSYIYEGIGKPKFDFLDTTSYVFPEPVGSEKDGLRLYEFDIFTRDQYWSEKGIRNNIGKKFIFNASLKWVSLPKESMKILWKAQKEKYFTFFLNEDKSGINFKTEVVALSYRFFKGIPGHRAGYTAEVRLRGTELLSMSGYNIFSGSGWGTDWGGNTENQSP